MRFRIDSWKIALATAAIGIMLLFLVQTNYEPRQAKIGEISGEKTGLAIEIKARVTWFAETEKAISFEIYDGNKIQAIKFNPSQEERKLVREKKFLKITGKIDSYQKKLQVLAEKIQEAG